MKTETKKTAIKKLVSDMLKAEQKTMMQQIDKILNSGAIDIESWDSKSSPMILPKCILTAILESSASQYTGKGTAFEKQVKKEVKNIKYFI